MTLSKRAKGLLFEAYRRNDMANSVEASKPLNRRWLGLGTAAAYRPAIKAGLMQFHDGLIPPARCMGWLCLTDLGIEQYQEYADEFQAALRSLKGTTYSESYRAQYMLAGGITR
mgnify:CR=1 FL=1